MIQRTISSLNFHNIQSISTSSDSYKVLVLFTTPAVIDNSLAYMAKYNSNIAVPPSDHPEYTIISKVLSWTAKISVTDGSPLKSGPKFQYNPFRTDSPSLTNASKSTPSLKTSNPNSTNEENTPHFIKYWGSS